MELHTFQDGFEFSTPRISNPIYDFASGCYDGQQGGGEFGYDPRLPLSANAAADLSAAKTLLAVTFLSSLLLLLTTSLH